MWDSANVRDDARGHKTNGNNYVENEQIRAIMKCGSQYQARLLMLTGKLSSLKSRTDAEFYKMYSNIHNNRNARGRDEFHADQIHTVLKKYIKTSIHYLDIGCGEGGITASLAKKLGVAETYGCDILEAPILNPDVQYSQVDGKTLPYGDAKFELITIIMALHHFQHLSEMLGEITRIIKKDGIIYIREHDSYNCGDAMLVDIQHKLFIAGIEKKALSDSGVIHHCNAAYWNREILKIGFEFLEGDFYLMGSPPTIGPTRPYWAVYRRKI